MDGASRPSPIDPERDTDQGNQYRDLDQRSDDGSEPCAMVDAEGRDGDGNCQFELLEEAVKESVAASA